MLIFADAPLRRFVAIDIVAADTLMMLIFAFDVAFTC